MRIGLLPLALVTGALIAAGVIVALMVGTSGGSAGDTSTLDGYFQALNTVQTNINSQYTAISAQHVQAFQEKKDTLDYLDAIEQALHDGLDGLKKIEPPDDASDAHNTLVDATDGVLVTFGSLRTGAEDAEDNATALAAVLQSTDTTAFSAYDTACSALQNLASQSNVTVQVPCLGDQ